MYRREDGSHLLFVLKILRYDENGLADSAVKGKRRVEHQRRVGGAVYILVGVADGDGTHSSSKATTDACYDKRRDSGQRKQGRKVVAPPFKPRSLKARRRIEPPHTIGNNQEQYDEIPVVKGLGEQYAAKVLLVPELVEDGGRRTSQGKGEIGCIAEIDSESEAVDNDEDHLTEAMPERGLLPM